MTSIVFYFQVHQPYRLRHYDHFDIGGGAVDYFDDEENARIVRRVADKCYVPMNEVLLEAIEETKGEFRCAFSISGTALQQMEDWAPAALDTFVALAETGCVEFLCETGYHSLAALADPIEFEAQVRGHRARIERLFGQTPTSFRNTELIFDNGIARRLEDLGFQTLLGEGADHLLGWRSPRRVYRPLGCEKMKLLLRDYLLSDDIAFRFSNPEWAEHPLMAETYAGWLHGIGDEDTFVGLFMDYETFGEHQWAATGILDFMRALPRLVLADPGTRFETPAQLAAAHPAVADLDAPRPISWADAERDLTAWLGNHMQRAAHEALYGLADDVRRAAALGHAQLQETWRKLTTSDHVYYMATKWHSDGDVHEYFTPYDSPHDSFIVFMNVLDDFRKRVGNVLSEPRQQDTKDEDPVV